MLNRKKSKGQSLVEYGLILALVAVLCIPALQGVQGGITTTLGRVSTALSTAGSSGGGDTPPILADPAEDLMMPPAVI